jgi:hypothetical protein
MRSERGQATVEWIGIVLLVALALAALARAAPSADGRELGTTLLHSVTCAARDGCEREGGGPPARRRITSDNGRAGPLGVLHRLVTIPPLVPHAGPAEQPWGRTLPSTRGTGWLRRTGGSGLLGSAPRAGGSAVLRWARRTGGRALEGEVRRMLRGRVLHGAGTAWRRAWFACLVYERFRYAFLHPESRLPGYTFPLDELLRIANDCISPVDLVRDWPLLTDG